MRFSIPRVRRSLSPRPFESLRAGKQEEADRAKASLACVRSSRKVQRNSTERRGVPRLRVQG
uniref:Uncharacterized protein n=1 Tax=Brassica oleracea TaxID=3712 RepID=A0A3P6GFR8_BRAOL|nr:unnamed protein product [Brassica oleracea]